MTERRAYNASCYAIGEYGRRGFLVRRIVWGRLLAREEKRVGETIMRAVILIDDPLWQPPLPMSD